MPRRNVKASPTDIDLNRWAIEMAMRWPIVTTAYGYGNAVQGAFHPNTPRIDQDADVIGRANKIIAWVKTPH